MIKTLQLLIIAMRPKQWTKNVVVFAGAFFAHRFLDPQIIIKEIAAFVLFCLISGSVYLLNDILDRTRDAQHPKKCHRPIAAGLLSVTTAAITSILIAGLCFMVSALVNPKFTLILVVYYAATACYSLRLKQVIILDVLMISSGFVLRAIGGAVAIDVEISAWFLICTIFLSLFLSLMKRRNEMLNLGDLAGEHRKTLSLYTPHLLDQMINVATASSIIAYSLYTLDDTTVAKFETHYLVLTVPFVLYGIFRYLYIGYNLKQGESPEITLISDKPLIINFLLYLITLVMVIYF